MRVVGTRRRALRINALRRNSLRSNALRGGAPATARSNAGAVLIVLLVAILAAGSLWLLELAAANREWNRHQRNTTESLAYAKEALLAYAVSYADNYGHNTRGGVGRLPCPANKKYGGPALSCGKGKTGYLPAVWSRGNKRLDIDHIEKFLDQDLWYSVSPTFRFNPAFNALNSDSDSDLLSVGSTDDVIAVIIAPGAPLQGQNRLRDNVGIGDYLEGENADQDLEFVVRHASNNSYSNDQLVWISRSELLPLIEKRLLGYVKDWLQEYYREFGYYPYAAPFDDPDGGCQSGLLVGRLPMGEGDCSQLPFADFVSETVQDARSLGEIWFNGSLWPDFVYYRVDAKCAPGKLSVDCPITVTGNDLEEDVIEEYALKVDGYGSKVLLVSAGMAIESVAVGRLQQRSPGVPSLPEYFEFPDLLSVETEMELRQPPVPVNDQYLVIR